MSLLRALIRSKVTGGSGGGDAVLIDKTITENGTYRAADDSADGYKTVAADVPIPTLAALTATENGTYNAPTGTAYNVVTVAIPKKETVEWHQCPEMVRSYLAAAAAAYPSDENVTVIDQYAPERGSEIDANTKPVGKIIDGATYYDNVPGVETPFATANKAGTITALDQVRWINTTSAATAAGETYPRGKNCRDLGGWPCDGGTIKYGMLFRGGEPNPIDRVLMVDRLGIKTEVQLLPVSEQADGYKMKSALGIDWAGNTTESSSVYTLNDSKQLWKKLLEPIMDSVIHAKPVLFHCGIGADRTGMIASALEGLLGVDRANIDMEYELTNFSTGWQSLAGGIYRARTYTSYKAIMTQQSNIPLLYGLANTFRNRWVSFVLSCGISIDKINAFRAAAIDGTPDIINVTVPSYTITNTLTNVTNSNASSSIQQYQTYSAKLSTSIGFAITAVTVTMGGVDITATAYADGTVSIPSVTGNIVITATATEIVRENLMTMNDGKINKRFNATNAESNINGYFVTDYFAYSGGGLRIVKGNANIGSLGTTSGYGNCRIGLYDSNKTFIAAAYIARNDGQSGGMGYMGFAADGDDLVCANLAASAAFSVDWSTVKYIRLTLALNNAASAIGSVADVTNSGMKIYAE